MLFILLLSSQITVSLEPTSQMVRFGDSFELITTISNAQQLTLAGYQIGFGWDADSLQMPAAPFVAPTDVLQDLFMFNAPPYGSGWASTPSAGDGIGREYAFLLGVALAASSQFSGTSGDLFRVPFIASQATQQAPVSFNIDELANDINQSTIVSDSSGGSLSVTLIDASVEIVPNISVSGTYQIGSSFSLELHDEPSHAYWVLASLAPAYINLNSVIGTLLVDTTSPSFRILGTGVTGVAPSIISRTIPGNANLVGRTAYFQAASGTGADRRLSNSCQFAIQ